MTTDKKHGVFTEYVSYGRLGIVLAEIANILTLVHQQVRKLCSLD